MDWQQLIAVVIVAVAAVWLGLAIYRSFKGRGGCLCNLCSKCFGKDSCPSDEDETGKPEGT